MDPSETLFGGRVDCYGRQGCPLSLYLFALSAEILSNKIRQGRDIKGIMIFGNEIKISQFADDTIFFLR